jgi:hypothetical protein
MPAANSAHKFKVKEGDILLTLNAPAGFAKAFGKLPPKAQILSSAAKWDQLHWFVLTKAQLDQELVKVLKLVREKKIIWVYYPKGSSGIQTDLTRDKGWESLTNNGDRLSWINLVSFDDTWSAFGFRAKTEADKKREAKAKPAREVFNYVNPKTREIILPDDLRLVLRKHKSLERFFETLSFTNKKEYIEWIVTAKRVETRNQRLLSTIERLGKGWKNPANR